MEAAGLEPANPGVAIPEPFQLFAPIIAFKGGSGSALPSPFSDNGDLMVVPGSCRLADEPLVEGLVASAGRFVNEAGASTPAFSLSQRRLFTLSLISGLWVANLFIPRTCSSSLFAVR